ncbi:MAG: hypothetical protein ACJ8H8_07085 [Geminicoccaceae bacterium]
MFFDYGQAQFRYTPFPIGIAKPVMPDARYGELVANFPPVELFESFEQMGKKGRKFTLSARENKKRYDAFVQGSPLWREFHRWIKSRDFVYGAIDMLARHKIDLGHRYVPPARRAVRLAKSLVRQRRMPSYVPLEARFEFSALPADGGNLPPHTDAPTKIVTMILSILENGEWDQAFGGGTDVNWPRNETRSFNQMNRVASFDEMDVLHTYPFTPNQCVVFIKTFNSWHSVAPMRGPHGKLRRTLTINIDAAA